jgi:hypothetical protein
MSRGRRLRRLPRVSWNTVCVEFCANKIVDGKAQKVIVLRDKWDRACWLGAQQVIARIFAEVATLPESSELAENAQLH